MEEFAIINTQRLKNHYISKEYKTFVKKSCKNGNSPILNKLELNTVKFSMLKSKRYMKKNMRIIKKILETYNTHSSQRKEGQKNAMKLKGADIDVSKEFLELYFDYCEGIYREDVNKIVEVRKKLETFSSFVDELDKILESYNYDISELKYREMWHDIEILMNTKNKNGDYYMSSDFKNSTKYYPVLLRNIGAVEKKTRHLKDLIIKDCTRIRCISRKCNVLYRIIESFREFLRSNYEESNYLNNLSQEVLSLTKYYEGIYQYSECKTSDLNIDFEVPESFLDVEEEIKKSASDVKIDKSKARLYLLDRVSKYLEIKDEGVNIPFVPVFYDIAFDYIEYPDTDKKLSEALGNLSLLE